MSRENRSHRPRPSGRVREAVQPLPPPYIPPAELYDDWPGTRFAYPHGYPQDRKAGANWPTIRNEVDLRTARAFSRLLADTNPLVIGFCDHITNFVVGTGYKWSVGLKGSPGNSPAEKRDPTVVACQAVLDEFRALNGWGDQHEVTVSDLVDGADDSPSTDLEAECWRSAMRDGETFLRLFKGGAGTNGVPRVRRVNPECVYCPPGQDTQGPWSFGIETDPDDRQTRLRVHIADPDKYPQDGEIEKAARVVHLKLNVDSDVKRGVPDFWPLEQEAQHLRKSWQNMAEVTAILSAIAYIRQHAQGVSGAQIRSMTDAIKSGTDAKSAKWLDQFQGGDIYRTYTRHEGGTVIDVTNGMEFVPPPAVAGMPGFIQGMQATLRIFGLRWGCPEYFSGDSSNANFASTLVAGGPFERSAQRRQSIYKQFQGNLIHRVLLLAVEAGRLSQEAVRKVAVKVTAPAVAIANKTEDTSRRMQLVQGAGLSKRTVLEEEGYDPDQEAANVQKEQPQQGGPGGDPNAPVPQGGPTPDAGGTGGPDIGGAVDQVDFSSLFEDRAGLVKKTVTTKTGKKQTVYVNPNKDAPGVERPGTTVADEPVPPEVAAKVTDPGRLKRFGLRLASLVFRAGDLMQQYGLPTVEAVFDTPSDLNKFGYAPTSMVDAGRGMAGMDPIREHLGISAHLAVSLIGKAASAVLAKIKAGTGKPTTEAVEGGDMGELVGLWRQILAAAHEMLDLPPETVPSDEQIAAGLESLKAKGQAAPVAEAVEESSPLPPELLAAILQAHANGDADAVAQLVELASDPALLGAVMDGPPDDAVTEAVDRSHLVFDKVKKRWVNPNKEAPVRKTPAGQMTPKEQLVARKQAAEPARQAARQAWGDAVADPSKVTAESLKGLADHLHALTRDELREVARGLQKKVGGLKREVVDRLLSHVGAQPTGGEKKTGGKEPEPIPVGDNAYIRPVGLDRAGTLFFAGPALDSRDDAHTPPANGVTLIKANKYRPGIVRVQTTGGPVDIPEKEFDEIGRVLAKNDATNGDLAAILAAADGKPPVDAVRDHFGITPPAPPTAPTADATPPAGDGDPERVVHSATHRASGLDFEVAADGTVAVRGRTADHAKALKAAGFRFVDPTDDDDADAPFAPGYKPDKRWVGTLDQAVNLDVPRSHDLPSDLGVRVKSKIGGRKVVTGTNHDPVSSPEAAKFTGTAANGVRYVDGVPQKGQEETTGATPQAAANSPADKAVAPQVEPTADKYAPHNRTRADYVSDFEGEGDTYSAGVKAEPPAEMYVGSKVRADGDAASRPWVAKLGGADKKFGREREFLRPSGVSGKAGKHFEYDLTEPGEYEVVGEYFGKKYRYTFTVVDPADEHKQAVSAAIAAGKLVPPEVLADYPDLAAAHPEAAKFTGTAANGVRYVDGVPQKGQEGPTAAPTPAGGPKAEPPAKKPAGGLPTVPPSAILKGDPDNTYRYDDPGFKAAGDAILADPKFRTALLDSYKEMMLFVQNRDGLVPLPQLYQSLTQAPEWSALTVPQFHAAMKALARGGVVEMRVLNEVADARMPELAYTENGRMKYYLMINPEDRHPDKLAPKK